MPTVLPTLPLGFRIRWHQWVVLGGLLSLLGMIDVAPVAAQEVNQTCQKAIAAADSSYVNGNFEAAIDQVSICLAQQDIPEDQAVRAYRLLSLAHLQQDELQQARAAIVNILSVRPGYEADPVEDPPSYVSLVSIVRQEVQPERPAEEVPEEDRSTPFFKRTSTWLGIIGSLAAGGVVTFLTLGQGGGDDGGGGGGGNGGPGQLPSPPGTPSGN